MFFLFFFPPRDEKRRGIPFSGGNKNESSCSKKKSSKDRTNEVDSSLRWKQKWILLLHEKALVVVGVEVCEFELFRGYIIKQAKEIDIQSLIDMVDQISI